MTTSQDCAGPGYCPSGFNSGSACFGYKQCGCSYEQAGRIWGYGSSYTYYGNWAP